MLRLKKNIKLKNKLFVKKSVILSTELRSLVVIKKKKHLILLYNYILIYLTHNCTATDYEKLLL